MRTACSKLRVNPHAPSNHQQSLPQTYRKHERAKILAYDERVGEIEHGSFTPLVMSLSGGLGNVAKVCLRRLASMLSESGTFHTVQLLPG